MTDETGETGVPDETPKNRRIDRILDPGFLDGLPDLPLEELRERRDECMAEREYVSLLRRLLQGRGEILKAELESRPGGGDRHSLVEHLASVLTDDEPAGPSRGEAVRVGIPDEEMQRAQRRVERLVADAGISDPSDLDDASLEAAIDRVLHEERELSDTRRQVLDVLDELQDELKRRYKDDPSLALA